LTYNGTVLNTTAITTTTTTSNQIGGTTLSNGSVGIGTATPTYPLDVASNARISGLFYAFSNAYVSSNLGVIGNVGVGTTTPAFALDLNINKIGNVGTQAFSLISSTTTASNTFTYTGSLANWSVPAGVTSVTVYMWGGGGGNFATGQTPGGGSAFVQGSLLTTPGETLTLLVGQGAGPFGGGGASYGPYGASGGGRSAILRGSTEVVDVGAGGGGSAGGGTGGAGVVTGSYSASAQNGGSGTQSAGGAGGSGGGLAGSQYIGANGGVSDSSSGGGGGYYGGGSGGYGRGYGGGGSSLIANLTSTTNSAAGSGTTPGGTGSAYYQAGIGVGSSTGPSGAGNGLIVLVYSTNVFSDYGSVAKDASSNMTITATSNLRLVATSNVGINQTTPAYPLDVAGTGRFTSNLYISSNVGIGGIVAPTVALDVAGQIRSRVVLSNITTTSATIDFTQTTGNAIYNYLTNTGFNAITLSNPGSGYVGAFSTFKNTTTTGMSVVLTYAGGATGPASPLLLYASGTATLIWTGTTYVQF
jgi:hypothetical protein